jgi:hypothetical protein
LRAHVFKGDIDLAADLPLCVVGYADTAGLRNPLQPRSNIDAIAEDIVVIDDDIADVNADPELDSIFMWHVGILSDYVALNLDRASRRVHGACELNQHTVAGGLDDAAAMLRDFGIDKGFSQRLQPESVPSSSPPMSRL